MDIVLIITFLVLIFLILMFTFNAVERNKNVLSNPEKFKNCQDNINYRNGIFQIRPPNCSGYKFKPYSSIFPTSIYKSNFLPHPIEGFTSNEKDQIFTKVNEIHNDKTNNDKMNNEEILNKLRNEMRDKTSSNDNLANMKNEMLLKDDFEKNKLNNEITKAENQIKLMFFDDNKCSKDYPNFTGATIEVGPNQKCNNSNFGNLANISEMGASAIAEIQNGSIISINVINGGTNMSNDVNIISQEDGTNKGAVAKAITDDNGTIKYVEIINGGEGFVSTPKIEFTQMRKLCYLCSK